MNHMCNPICDQRDLKEESNKTMDDGKNESRNSVLALVGN